MTPEKPTDEGDISPEIDGPNAAHLETIISDSESLLGSFTSRDGVVRTRAGERTVVEQTVFTAVTDQRILLTIPDSQQSGAVVLRYDEIASISVGEPVLSLTTMDGVGLEWRGPSSVPSTVAAHLRWVGGIRARLRSLANDIDLAAGKIRTHADGLEWELGLETYREARETLDELLIDVFCTAVVPESVLAPEVTDLERTLETAHTRLFIERGQDQLDLARQLITNGDYEQSRHVLEEVLTDLERAQSLRAAVERADAFQFGTQRDLAADIESLGWELETVAAEPLREAHEAKITAESADPEQAIEHWERAFTLYEHVLTLEWRSDDHNFAGDPDRVRSDLEYTAVQLIDCHSTLADDWWNEGAAKQEAGELKPALQACLNGQDHLERAHELAAEYAPNRVDAIGQRLETMVDAVLQLRYAEPTADDPTPEQTAADSEMEADPADGERAIPSADDLAEMDTHHEITLDSTEWSDEEEIGPAERDDTETTESTDNEARKH